MVIAKHTETIKKNLFHNFASGGPLKVQAQQEMFFTTAAFLYEVSSLMWCDLCLRAKIIIKLATKSCYTHSFILNVRKRNITKDCTDRPTFLITISISTDMLHKQII